MPGDPRVQLLTELADETRYAVLERLEAGPASASELSELLQVGPTRLANHLRRLRDAGLVTVSHHGRLAIYQLAEPGLREIFSMLNGLRGTPPATGGPVPAVATCYDHLAGQLGVALMDHLVQSGALHARAGEGELGLGPAAAGILAGSGGRAAPDPPPPDARLRLYGQSRGAPAPRRPPRRAARRLVPATWLARASWAPRRVRVTPAGRTALDRLGSRLQPQSLDPGFTWRFVSPDWPWAETRNCGQSKRTGQASTGSAGGRKPQEGESQPPEHSQWLILAVLLPSLSSDRAEGNA